tara:strand:+ start:86992 stop:87507 length:516 start_codon:yes stop_codon:yes gene_type:complete
MKIQTQLFAVALAGMSASCGTVSDSHDHNSPSVVISTPDEPAGDESVTTSDVDAARTAAPAPAGETAPATPAVPSQFAHLETFDVSSVVVGRATKVGEGRFVGNLELDQTRLKVTGAGAGMTIIDGNLIVGSQCSVVGLTVTGDVIFRGNNSSAYVDCLGQVLDYGMQNRH